MLYNHLILCHPLLLLPSILPSIRVFSNESALHIRWPKYWSFSFSFSPSGEYSGLISFRIDCFDFLSVQGTIKLFLKHHCSKGASGKKKPNCQCRRHKFHPWVRKIPWRREWQPTPVFLAGESPRTEEPGGLQSMGSQRVRHYLAQHTRTSSSRGILSFLGPLCLPPWWWRGCPFI